MPYSFTVQFNVILPSTARSSKWCLPWRFLTWILHAFLFFPITCYMPDLAPYSQTPSAYVPPLIWATNFDTHTKHIGCNIDRFLTHMTLYYYGNTLQWTRDTVLLRQYTPMVTWHCITTAIRSNGHVTLYYYGNTLQWSRDTVLLRQYTPMVTWHCITTAIRSSGHVTLYYYGNTLQWSRDTVLLRQYTPVVYVTLYYYGNTLQWSRDTVLLRQYTPMVTWHCITTAIHSSGLRLGTSVILRCS